MYLFIRSIAGLHYCIRVYSFFFTCHPPQICILSLDDGARSTFAYAHICVACVSMCIVQLAFSRGHLIVAYTNRCTCSAKSYILDIGIYVYVTQSASRLLGLHSCRDESRVMYSPKNSIKWSKCCFFFLCIYLFFTVICISEKTLACGSHGQRTFTAIVCVQTRYLYNRLIQ